MRQQKSLLMEELRRSASQRRRFGVVDENDEDPNEIKRNDDAETERAKGVSQQTAPEERRKRHSIPPPLPMSRPGQNKQGEMGKNKSLDEIVRGSKDESAVTQTQRQLKLSLNDEIRMKMQERLKVMNESDSEEDTNVNDLD